MLSASGCPHANRNKARSMDSSFSMSPGVFKYSSVSGHIKPGFGASLSGSSGEINIEDFKSYYPQKPGRLRGRGDDESRWRDLESAQGEQSLGLSAAPDQGRRDGDGDGGQQRGQGQCRGEGEELSWEQGPVQTEIKQFYCFRRVPRLKDEMPNFQIIMKTSELMYSQSWVSESEYLTMLEVTRPHFSRHRS